ncbi:MAG: hypothetical protein Q9199_002979 [Rusavskia elegans]
MPYTWMAVHRGYKVFAAAYRDSPFQVLADGTQDLAALVGIFATNSVERYAIDYTKGYVSVASAMLSLLGLLGYVRALVKLCLGLDGCQNAGFDTRSLRPIFGIPDEDRLPSDAVHKVYYVERLRSAQHVTWKLAATRKHTVDSMPVLALAIPHSIDDVARIMISSCGLSTRTGNWFKKHAWYQIPATLTFMIALTCFIIIPVRGGLRNQGWTMFNATFGLFFTLSLCSIMWAIVYAQEQVPKGDIDWIQRVTGQRSYYQKSSLERKDNFAFTGSGYSYTMFDLKAVTGKTREAVRAASMVGAGLAIIGYLCQYVEVRQTTAKQAIVWLFIQAFLAVVRVAVWILNPSFDDFSMKKERTLTHIQMSEAQLVMLWYSHIHPTRHVHPNASSGTKNLHIHEIARRSQACPRGWYYQSIPEVLTVPKWVLRALHVAETNVHNLFSTALLLFKSRGVEWQDTFNKVAKAERYWDMPQWIFMLWVDAHSDHSILAQDHLTKGPRWKSYSCRVIQAADGSFSFIPYWTADCLRLKHDGTDDPLRNISPLHGRTPSGMCVFGDPGTDDYSIVTSCHGDEEDAAMPRSQSIRTGFEDFKKYKWLDLEALRREMIQHYNEMWEKLELIIHRARILNAKREEHERLQDLRPRSEGKLLRPYPRFGTFTSGHIPGIDGAISQYIESHPDTEPRSGRPEQACVAGSQPKDTLTVPTIE